MRQVGYGMLLSRKVDAIRLAAVSDDVSQATRNWPGGARILTHLFPNPSM